MISRQVIIKEIDNIPEERLDELHEMIKEFAYLDKTAKKESLMSKLIRTKIYGPKDFAKNILMKDRNISDALTVDKHFEQAGFNRIMTEE